MGTPRISPGYFLDIFKKSGKLSISRKYPGNFLSTQKLDFSCYIRDISTFLK